SPAARPATRIFSMISGDFTRGSAQRVTGPSAYGGRRMWGGTVRSGLTRPGSTRPSIVLWQRLYLRPLPHQHGSFDLSATVLVGAVTPSSVGSRGAAPRTRGSRRRPVTVPTGSFTVTRRASCA